MFPREGYVFNVCFIKVKVVGGQTGKDCLLTWADEQAENMKNDTTSVRMRSGDPLENQKRRTVSGGALHMQRKVWAAADFQNFLARPNTRRPRKKRRLGNAEPRSTEANRQMLLNTSRSHTSQAALFGVSGSRIRHSDFPICVFFGHSLVGIDILC